MMKLLLIFYIIMMIITFYTIIDEKWLIRNDQYDCIIIAIIISYTLIKVR